MFRTRVLTWHSQGLVDTEEIVCCKYVINMLWVQQRKRGRHPGIPSLTLPVPPVH